MAVLKIHSHPGYYERFSEVDDASDGDLFPSLHGWTDNGLPHASAVMLPDGRIFGRAAFGDGTYAPLDRVAVAGDDILFFDAASPDAESVEQLRTRQAFGLKTTRLLKSLRVGIVRLLWDGKLDRGTTHASRCWRNSAGRSRSRCSEKTLIESSLPSERDAEEKRPKVDAVGERLMTYGTGTRRFRRSRSPTLIIDRRQRACGLRCRLRVHGFYRRPRIVKQSSSLLLGPIFRTWASNYAPTAPVVSRQFADRFTFLYPTDRACFSRGVYTPEMLGAEALRRTNPERYASELKKGLSPVQVGAPAVISVNGFCAAMAVNELLARLHLFRDAPNSKYRWQQFDIVNSYWQPRDAGEPCRALARSAGRGDMVPLLNCNLIAPLMKAYFKRLWSRLAFWWRPKYELQLMSIRPDDLSSRVVYILGTAGKAVGRSISMPLWLQRRSLGVNLLTAPDRPTWRISQTSDRKLLHLPIRLDYHSWSKVTENIAETPNYAEVVNLWANSPGHAENMRADTPFVCVRQAGNYFAYEGMKP